MCKLTKICMFYGFSNCFAWCTLHGFSTSLAQTLFNACGLSVNKLQSNVTSSLQEKPVDGHQTLTFHLSLATAVIETITMIKTSGVATIASLFDAARHKSKVEVLMIRLEIMKISFIYSMKTKFLLVSDETIFTHHVLSYCICLLHATIDDYGSLLSNIIIIIHANELNAVGSIESDHH